MRGREARERECPTETTHQVISYILNEISVQLRRFFDGKNIKIFDVN